ncbi:MAG: UDP-N-acetylglucosamine--LPS N-acetylglucosamine transferase [Pseudomonadota bacterium]|nr:UDP-N-acetylglucosamine--LPS N-acetylglucosamine transferase [Pseudomonadota bacterium]MEE3101752.1 UDP-N-acetylglucosamine--LPS N-acetylglucosamine transferase [Pseudomonadota bacterium]
MLLSRPPEDPARLRVLAVASAGGHLVQLRRLRRAFAGCRTVWVVTDPVFAADIRRDAERDGAPPPEVRAVPEGSLWSKVSLLRQMLAIAWIVVRVRPHAVVTTGAAPGYFAIRLARLLGARRTVWIDSVANADELSRAGREAGRHADLFLTQWPHLAAAPGEDDPKAPRCWGAVI